jgi:hypothetical protein
VTTVVKLGKPYDTNLTWKSIRLLSSVTGLGDTLPSVLKQDIQNVLNRD